MAVSHATTNLFLNWTCGNTIKKNIMENMEKNMTLENTYKENIRYRLEIKDTSRLVSRELKHDKSKGELLLDIIELEPLKEENDIINKVQVCRCCMRVKPFIPNGLCGNCFDYMMSKIDLKDILFILGVKASKNRNDDVLRRINLYANMITNGTYNGFYILSDFRITNSFQLADRKFIGGLKNV